MRYLQRSGYLILETNWHCRWGELDIVARQGQELVFIEVKFRSSNRCGLAAESITRRKLASLGRSIDIYLKEKRLLGTMHRLDAICLDGVGKSVRMHHYKLI